MIVDVQKYKSLGDKNYIRKLGRVVKLEGLTIEKI